MAEAHLPKGYEPKDVEDRWLSKWQQEKTFSPDSTLEAGQDAYSIVIPPPNVTGTLHMGHALNLTLQDILCRYNRQKGKKVLWVPGTDHAGIATQNVVEKALAQEGQSRQDLGREAFVERVWQWKEEYGGKILNQIQRMGASVDWSRLRFTMDEGLSRAVREVFVQLYTQGLIYQGNYIINWCPRCHTALADLEVEYAEKEGGLYEIQYPLASGAGHLIVATTRPETMLGDTALAVHPEDERFNQLIGQRAIVPLVQREIPIIGDEYVEREFGTGCLKVTPAHDPNDFELGGKHGLDSIRVIDDAGVMTEAAGAAYAGLDRFAARKQVLRDLEAQSALASHKKYLHNVGHCYRCDTPIEPTVSKQWFVAVGPLAKQARDAVAEGHTRIVPDNWDKTYFEWLDNIRDWCISRQIWWGHRIPAWTCQSCGELLVRREDPAECPQCGHTELHQDEDVLDTWFSSALWPFSTLGWPDETQELQTFYPTSVLVTGFDILFFWVARMMMMGLHCKQEVPFDDVYIHALVRDEDGRKMSKSTGNVIDPLDMVHKYGTDALRFTLTAFAAMGRDVKLSEKRIEGYRHFMNKIWNAARFALMHLPADMGEPQPDPGDSLTHRWILHRLEEVKAAVATALDDYRFNDAAQELYQFVWHELCDWYLEMVKPELYGDDAVAKQQAQSVLHTVLREVLVLLHPIIPFISAEIWGFLPEVGRRDLALEPFPATRPQCVAPQVQEAMEFVQQVVVSVRTIRGELNINPSLALTALVRARGEQAEILLGQAEVIRFLARIDSLQVDAELKAPKGAGTAVVNGAEIFVPLEGIVDFEAELARLDKEMGKLDKTLQGVQAKLANANFVDKAPAEVVDKEKAKAAELEEKKSKMVNLQKRLQAMGG